MVSPIYFQLLLSLLVKSILVWKVKNLLLLLVENLIFVKTKYYCCLSKLKQLLLLVKSLQILFAKIQELQLLGKSQHWLLLLLLFNLSSCQCQISPILVAKSTTEVVIKALLKQSIFFPFCDKLGIKALLKKSIFPFCNKLGMIDIRNEHTADIDRL